MSRIIFIIGLLILCGPVWAVNDVSKVGTTAGEILSMPASARGLAMGNAVAGLVDDGSVFFWNPAMAAGLTQSRISASYLPWLVDTDFQHFAFATPAGAGFVVGGFIASWSMDDMKVTNEFYQQGTGQYFNASDLVIALSVARNLTARFSIGANLKYIQERIASCTARGVAMDFGTVYRTGVMNDLRIITTLNNYGSQMQMSGRDLNILHDLDLSILGHNDQIPADYSTNEWPLPLNFRFGVATEILKMDGLRLSAELDAIHPSNNYEALELGMELALGEMLFLRGGLSSLAQEDTIEGVSMGAGVQVHTPFGLLQADYGYRDYGDLGYIQAMTLGVRL